MAWSSSQFILFMSLLLAELIDEGLLVNCDWGLAAAGTLVNTTGFTNTELHVLRYSTTNSFSGKITAHKVGTTEVVEMFGGGHDCLYFSCLLVNTIGLMGALEGVTLVSVV